MGIPKNGVAGGQRTHTVKRLRMYEAGYFVHGSIGDELRMDVLSPFGPLIGQTRISDETVRYLNSEADQILTAGKNAEFQIPEAICRTGPHSFRDCVARGLQL